MVVTPWHPVPKIVVPPPAHPDVQIPLKPNGNKNTRQKNEIKSNKTKLYGECEALNMNSWLMPPLCVLFSF